ncbi:hypothetical protein PAECIP111891_02163 [Paenibacillus allorhizoplanae]|uniref:Apea-like HEPN domain-containing protein n=2 Tax=Paenibacillus allorhizoplanae TaxID=2905648 RepID=A0ABM9C347_9BACL|nr:hypothetical protein PAECIP111891_02163 [Paenibacillus allorhizoplanae]
MSDIEHEKSKSNNILKLPNYFERVSNLLNFKKVEMPKIQIDPQRYYLAAENLGKRGWTIPFSFTPRQIAFFEEPTLTSEEIDNFFHAYYSDEDNFNKLFQMIYSISSLKQWHLAIRQCEIAHRKELFILSISTLLPVLEGILSKFENDKNNIRMIKVCKQMLDDSLTKESWVFSTIWNSCFHFITTLYAKSNFSEEEPILINRHWILHGRTEFNNSELDSIKLFNALETIANIIKFNFRNNS